MRLALIAAIAALAGCGSTAPPAWRPVVADWYADGRFDQPHSCRDVRAALRHLPAENTAQDVVGAFRGYARRVC